MKCPFCGKIFKISQKQKEENTKFRCSHCRCFNLGSIKTIQGVLIGEKSYPCYGDMLRAKNLLE